MNTKNLEGHKNENLRQDMLTFFGEMMGEEAANLFLDYYDSYYNWALNQIEEMPEA